MNDKQKTIETPSGNKVVLKTEMTARDYRALRGLWFKDIEIGGVSADSTPELKGLKGTIIEEVENKALELMIISIDDNSENILERLMDMPMADYEVVFQAVNDLTENLGQKKTD